MDYEQDLQILSVALDCGVGLLIQVRWLWLALGWNAGHWMEAKCPGLLLSVLLSSRLEIRGRMKAEKSWHDDKTEPESVHLPQ